MPVSQQADILILYNHYIQYSKDTKMKGTRLVSTEDGARIQKETKDISLSAIWYKSYFQYGRSCRSTQGHPAKTKGTSQLSVTTPWGYACASTGSRKENRGPAGWRKTGKGLHAQCGTENSLSTLVIGTGLGTGLRGTWYTRGPGFD